MGNKQLTAREFVLAASATYRCPFCGAAEVTWSLVDVIGGSAYQAGRCGACGKLTTAIFRLVGYMIGDDVRTITEDFGEIAETPEACAIRNVDYRLLDRQIKRLGKLIRPPAQRRTPGQIQTNQDLEGLYELLCQIHEKRPFPAGKEE